MQPSIWAWIFWVSLVLVAFGAGFGVFALTHPSPAPPPGPVVPDLSIPASLSCNAGDVLHIDATTKGSTVQWICDGAHVVRGPTGLSVAFFATKPGVYSVYAYTAVNGEPSDPALCIVTVQGPQPGPAPGPAPGPTPTPDSLQKALLDALTQEQGSSADLLKQVAALSNFYYSAQAVAMQQSVRTAGDLYKALTTEAQRWLPSTALPKVRRVIADELNRALPTDAGHQLTAAEVQAAVAEFKKVHDALDALQKERFGVQVRLAA